MFELKCSNCGSPLEIDENHIIAFCPYCGQKITFDAEQLSAILLEKEKTKQIKTELEHEEEMKKVQIKKEWHTVLQFITMFAGLILLTFLSFWLLKLF